MKGTAKNPVRDAHGTRECLTIVFKRKKLILGVFFAISVTAIAASFLITPAFEARSSLMVKLGREYLNRPEVGSNTPVMSLNQEEVTNSEIQILKNRDLIEKVITTLKLESVYPELSKRSPARVRPLDMAIERFENDLTVEGMRKTNVINVSFRHPDPQTAARAVNLLVELFKEKHLQVFSDPKSSFLETQLMTYDKKLRESESRLQEYKQKAGVFSLEEQRTLLLTQRNELDTALKGTRHTISELYKRIASQKQQLARIAAGPARYTSTERDRIIVEAKSKLLTLQLNEQELLKKYTENNRLVVNARREIQMVKDFLRDQESDIVAKVKTGNQVYQSTELELNKAETELNAQKGKAQALNQQLAEVDGEIRALDASEKNMQTLKRDLLLNEKNYQTYLEKAEEARITVDMNRLKLANISVIQKATPPVEPVSPKKLLNAVLGIVVGALAGLGLAFLSESSSYTFTTPEQVEHRTGLPVLTSIAQHEG